LLQTRPCRCVWIRVRDDHTENMEEALIESVEKATIGGGMPFKEAIIGIWLCDKPADKNLKKGMLGR